MDCLNHMKPLLQCECQPWPTDAHTTQCCHLLVAELKLLLIQLIARAMMANQYRYRQDSIRISTLLLPMTGCLIVSRRNIVTSQPLRCLGFGKSGRGGGNGSTGWPIGTTIAASNVGDMRVEQLRPLPSQLPRICRGLGCCYCWILHLSMLYNHELVWGWTCWRANKRKIQDVLEVGISIDLHATLLSLTIDLIGYDGILLPLLPR